MGERYFRVYEVSTWSSPWTDPSLTITESELERRIDAVITGRLRDGLKAQDLIPILLHGEGEKGETEIPKQTTMGLYRCDPAHKGPRKPSPTPIRAEWEAWAQDKPQTILYSSYETWAEAVCKWLLSMPIVPKE